jgi:putative transposase
MIRFIDDHRADHGVEPICRVLPIAPATFYDNKAKQADPSRLSDRAKRDEQLKPEIDRVFEENLKVYGARKVWHQMRREGFDIARCTVARLMKDLGL